MTRITKLLFKKGATIHELNTVRKHLSSIQGGQLARIAYPATVIGLIYSDIPDNDLSMVASGPTFLDTTTTKDAENILAKYNVIKTCRIAGCNLQATPKDPNIFTHVQNELIVDNKMAVKSMAQRAKQLGYRTRVYSTTIDGNATATGQLLASLAQPKHAIIAAGETTVNITKPGQGGRNLDVSLSALAHLRKNSLVISFATDGIDHVPVAGAIADDLTKQKSIKYHLDPATTLTNNQSYKFFKQTGDLIITGPTGRNVSDLMLVLAT